MGDTAYRKWDFQTPWKSASIVIVAKREQTVILIAPIKWWKAIDYEINKREALEFRTRVYRALNSQLSPVRYPITDDDTSSVELGVEFFTNRPPSSVVGWKKQRKATYPRRNRKRNKPVRSGSSVARKVPRVHVGKK